MSRRSIASAVVTGVLLLIAVMWALGMLPGIQSETVRVQALF